MENDLASKLRAEIGEAQKRRHEFLMRKLAFTTSLLGIGSLTIAINPNQHLNALLLYLVPFVALAYDFYIVDEDYGIKRAGQFLSQRESGASVEERKWEEFVQTRPNRFAPWASCIVTLTLIAGALIVLWQAVPSKKLLLIWLGLVIPLEMMILRYHVTLRKHLLR